MGDLLLKWAWNAFYYTISHKWRNCKNKQGSFIWSTYYLDSNLIFFNIKHVFCCSVWTYIHCVLDSLINCISLCHRIWLVYYINTLYSRLLSLSYLKNTPTQTLWRKAKNMDAERKRRISQQSTKWTLSMRYICI